MRTEVEFLGAETGREIAQQYGRADLVAANNVFAHVPDIGGFAAGLARWSRTTAGHAGVPAPAAADRARQFDTIYHEHYSYLSADLVPGAGDGRTPGGRRR